MRSVGFETLMTTVLMAMMAMVVVLSVADLGWLLIKDISSPPFVLLDVRELLDVFDAFLLVLMGIELFETLPLTPRNRGDSPGARNLPLSHSAHSPPQRRVTTPWREKRDRGQSSRGAAPAIGYSARSRSHEPLRARAQVLWGASVGVATSGPSVSGSGLPPKRT